MIPGIESQRHGTSAPIIERLYGERIALTCSRSAAVLESSYPAQAERPNPSEDDFKESSKPARWTLAPSQESRAKQLMLQHLTSRVRIEDVAEACSLSRSHFSRAFKANTGVSPLEWLTNARVERAKELLSTSTLAVSDVALDCGFCDQSHFTRVFRSRVGVSPSAWRKGKVSSW